VDGLLDVSRMARGKLRLERATVDLAALCGEVVADVRAGARDRELALRFAIPAQPVWVQGDRARLTQVIDNLLGNALKYSRGGEAIEVSLRAEAGEAVLEVRDEGEGIDPAFLPHVFEVFRQAEQAIDRAPGGLGVGLTLVRLIVERHGGTVRAESEGLGQGARFMVTLPLTEAPASETGPRPHGDASLTVLVVEDNEDAAEALCALLEAMGHEATRAGDGHGGIERALRERPDVVLCDLGLPGGVTGFDVARALRDEPSLAGTPLVAVSGYGRPEDRQQATEAGFDMHLTKPLERTALRQALERLRGGDGE
jgi:CheY-like chemotaxis protein/two-component sensor histidine kinase